MTTTTRDEAMAIAIAHEQRLLAKLRQARDVGDAEAIARLVRCLDQLRDAWWSLATR